MIAHLNCMVFSHVVQLLVKFSWRQVTRVLVEMFTCF